jgi:pimeloyl-ACP methyl ester carboxylesterase
VAGGRTTTVIAHDWGALLAWLVASADKSPIDRLVVLNMPHPACFLRELAGFRQRLRSWYIYFARLPWLPELLMRRWGVDLLHWVSGQPADFEGEPADTFRRNLRRDGGARAMINWYRALALPDEWAWLQDRAQAARIQIPTLLIWGESDVAFRKQALEGLEAFVENLELQILRGAAHDPHQQRPLEVNALIANWLAGKGRLRAS